MDKDQMIQLADMIGKLVMVSRGSEPLDGDEIEELMRTVRHTIRINEGDIDEKEFEENPDSL
jgi:hypothetical protein